MGDRGWVTGRAPRAVRRYASRALLPVIGSVTSVDTDDPVFALTFDDGPDPEYTPEVLRVLEAHGMHGTFFMLGEQAARHPELVERVASAGHCVANHSWDHQSLVFAAPAQGWAAWCRAQVIRGAAALGDAGSPLFRPPYGDLDVGPGLVVRRTGHTTIAWNVSARDWRVESPDVIAASVLDQVGPGSIVLFHDRLADSYDPAAFARDQTVQALELLLERLEGRLRSVTVPELLARGPARRSLRRAVAPPTARFVQPAGPPPPTTDAGRLRLAAPTPATPELSSRDAGPPPPEDERVAAGGAPTPEHSATLAAFSRPEVVEVYTERGSQLWACEEALFDRHLPPGARVLDLGVGTGRTTERLAANATRYVGLDFAPPMVDACRKRFPHLEFVCGDASDLQQFADDSFDVVVFSFNGIDCLHPDAARFRCIRSIRRVLAPGGVLLLSEHNPLVLVSRPRPVRGVPPKLAAARLARAARESLANVVRLVRSNRGSRVDGFYFDPAHGGNWWHAASPNRVRAEFASFGFEPLGEPIGVDHPRSGPLLATAWYYYAFRLPGTARPAVVVEAAATGT